MPTLPNPSISPTFNFNQVLSGDVKIKEINNNDYKITFSKKNISDVLLYQIWSETSKPLNNDRKLVNIKVKNWVKIVFPDISPPPNIPFTPTTIMELRDDEGKYERHVFIINRVKFNKHDKLVFKVSSTDIAKNNTNKKIKKFKKIPSGEFHNARFDIDSCSCDSNCRNQLIQIGGAILEFFV
jgi:hypothetical protein